MKIEDKIPALIMLLLLFAVGVFGTTKSFTAIPNNAGHAVLSAFLTAGSVIGIFVVAFQDNKD